jgi:hypothetical protein
MYDCLETPLRWLEKCTKGVCPQEYMPEVNDTVETPLGGFRKRHT